MTAVNALILANERTGYLLTDTAATRDDNGVVDAFLTKVATSPSGRFAIAARGRVEAIRWATGTLIWAQNIDEVQLAGPALLRGTWDQVCRNGWSGTGIEIVVVGWSDAEERMIALSTRHDYESPFDFMQCTAIQCPPEGEDIDGDALGRSPEQGMLNVMHRQRANPANFLNGRPCIGGSAELTMVTAHGIRQVCLHRWPDKIGELIKP